MEKIKKIERVSYIHAQCKTRDKARWVKAARSEGVKLTEWIVNKLNQENSNESKPL